MTKRILTPEQTAARDARKERFRSITKTVAAMTDEQRAELARTMGAVQTCEGRSLSFKNTCLLAIQAPTATLVGGFRQWLRQGRVVRKGEHGHMIWIPTGVGRSDLATLDRSDPTEAAGSDGPRFITGTIFDIAQTQALEVEVSA